jgi:hypothetical protein
MIRTPCFKVYLVWGLHRLLKAHKGRSRPKEGHREAHKTLWEVRHNLLWQVQAWEVAWRVV